MSAHKDICKQESTKKKPSNHVKGSRGKWAFRLIKPYLTKINTKEHLEHNGEPSLLQEAARHVHGPEDAHDKKLGSQRHCEVLQSGC